jgi:PAS domain S-box-containing protein
LEEAEETLRAIRAGEVDALVVDGATGPQIYALQGLDAETNRFRGQILAQISDSVIASNNEERIVYLNSAAEQLYGVTASEALGRLLSDIYVRRRSDPDDNVVVTRALDECGEWRGETVHMTHAGRELQVESRLTRMNGIDGRPTGTLAVVRDISERNRREERVHISEIRYRRLFEAAHDGVLILDSGTGKIIEANPFMTRMLGYPHDYLIGKELFEIGLLKDEAASREMFEKLKRANEVRYENLPLEGDAGQHQEVEVVANLYDENGRSVIQCNIRDITERKRSEEHVKLLMAEVNHRAKNLLAVVQAVAQQTAKYGDPTTFATRLSERIAGLAAGQDLLVRTEWQGIAVSDLVAAQLAHFGDLMGKRVLLDGPVVWLTAPAAQGIGMALHELATNAAKYGALSNREGKVRIRWGVTPGADSNFSMSWAENGGPRVGKPTRKGFGQIVIGRMAEASVGGVAEIAFREGGFSWALTAPAKYTLAVSWTEAK